MKKKKLLVATTNKGKAREIEQFLVDLPFEFVKLDFLKNIWKTPEEIGVTLEQNAILKACHYARETKMLTIADDGGLFIDALNGWPGIKSARSFKGDQAIHDKDMLQTLRSIPKQNRGAEFKLSIAVHDPIENTTFTSTGSLRGEIKISHKANKKLRWGYNSIFYVNKFSKTYGEMTVAEKNAISHRGKAMIKIKRYLQNQFRGKHFVVPIAFIVQDGLILMNKRNDPHNTIHHGIWEFPGGSVEIGENLEESLKKECFEETGYKIKIIEELSSPFVKTSTESNGDCQFYIVPYVCKIIGGRLNPSSVEVLETSWKSYDEALRLKKFPGDNLMLKKVRAKFESIILKHSL